MKPLLLLATAILLCHCGSAQAATLLFHHTGAADPTTEGWTTSGTSSTQAITGEAVNAWQVFEQGGTNSRTYNRTLTSPQLNQALTTGWELAATIKFVPPDPLAATGLSNNAWCTLLIDEGVVIDSVQKRMLYGLYFGNDALGNTLVRLYASGATYTVTAGYHDYRLVYDPLLGNASFYIDGTLTATGYEGSQIDNTGTSRVYWGDNTTTSATPGRGANYAYVALSVDTVPEPSRAVLVWLALTLATLRRHRRPITGSGPRQTQTIRQSSRSTLAPAALSAL